MPWGALTRALMKEKSERRARGELAEGAVGVRTRTWLFPTGTWSPPGSLSLSLSLSALFLIVCD